MTQDTGKTRILFLCTGNSCRSQMAEGFAKALKSEIIEAYSAGTEPKRLDPRAVTVMKEAGIDISAARAKHVNELEGIEFDYVITLCGHARENCPLFPGKTRVLHHGFEDPPQLAAESKTEEEALSHYRRIRDEIRGFIESLPESLGKDAAQFFLR
jgi:arsenate reductase